MNPGSYRTAATLALLCAALPALADTQFKARRMTRDDIPLGKGQCDIRLQVDNEVEVSVVRDMVFLRTVAGRDARDDGSECNAPIPDREVQNFNFQVTESRNDIQLLAGPSRRNGFATVVLIRDSAGGEGRYCFRISWQMTGSDTSRRGASGFPPSRGPAFPPENRSGPPRFAWNNVLRFDGVGRGSSELTAYGSQRLPRVSVQIDRGGRVTVTFPTETERPLVLNGTVVGREGGQLRADMVTEDRRLRGPMYLTIDGRDEVESISFEGVDGFSRLHLNWSRR